MEDFNFYLCCDELEEGPRDYQAEMNAAISERKAQRDLDPDSYTWSESCAEDFDVMEPFNSNPLYCWLRPIWNYYEQACVVREQEDIYCKDACRFGWGLEFAGTPTDFLLYYAPYTPLGDPMVEDGVCCGE